MKKLAQLFRPRYIKAILKTLNREAAFDSIRHILMVFGASAILGMLAVMKWYFILPAVAFLALVWYVDYLRHDFHPQETALENAEIVRDEIGKPITNFQTAKWYELQAALAKQGEKI